MFYHLGPLVGRHRNTVISGIVRIVDFRRDAVAWFERSLQSSTAEMPVLDLPPFGVTTINQRFFSGHGTDAAARDAMTAACRVPNPIAV